MTKVDPVPKGQSFKIPVIDKLNATYEIESINQENDLIISFDYELEIQKMNTTQIEAIGLSIQVDQNQDYKNYVEENNRTSERNTKIKSWKITEVSGRKMTIFL